MSGQETAGRSRLPTVRRRLSEWRERHGGRGRPIPAELWDAAVAIARTDGVAQTARALGVDRRRLERLAATEPALAAAALRVAPPPSVASPTSLDFVQLDTEAFCPRGHAVVQLEGADGERVRVELSGACAVDVVALSRAFWSRGRCCS
jgi:hypothetical protein